MNLSRTRWRATFYRFLRIICLVPVVLIMRFIAFFLTKSERASRIRDLERTLAAVETFDLWGKCAAELDSMNGYDIWRDDPDLKLGPNCPPEVALLRGRTIFLRSHLAHPTSEESTRAIAHYIQTELCRDLGGLDDPANFGGSSHRFTATAAHCGAAAVSHKTRAAHPFHCGARQYVDEYLVAVVDACSRLVHAPTSHISLADRISTFTTASAAFGHTALLLSGGATVGMHHLGVVATLLAGNALPRVISGASAGSIIAALTCCFTDDELRSVIYDKSLVTVPFFANTAAPGGVRTCLLRLAEYGSLMSSREMLRELRNLLADTTFAEAHTATGRVLNISISSAWTAVPFLCNFVSSPRVLVRSAVAASCCFPSLFDAQPLLEKAPDGSLRVWQGPPGHGRTGAPEVWWDGSITADLPKQRTAQLFGVNHFVVSQVNPWIVPFFAVYRLPWWIRAPLFALTRALTAARVPLLSAILKQRYSGDVTLVPRIQVLDFAMLVDNPTTWMLEHALMSGQRAAWPAIPRLRRVLALESSLHLGLLSCLVADPAVAAAAAAAAAVSGACASEVWARPALRMLLGSGAPSVVLPIFRPDDGATAGRAGALLGEAAGAGLVGDGSEAVGCALTNVGEADNCPMERGRRAIARVLARVRSDQPQREFYIGCACGAAADGADAAACTCLYMDSSVDSLGQQSASKAHLIGRSAVVCGVDARTGAVVDVLQLGRSRYPNGTRRNPARSMNATPRSLCRADEFVPRSVSPHPSEVGDAPTAPYSIAPMRTGGRLVLSMVRSSSPSPTSSGLHQRNGHRGKYIRTTDETLGYNRATGSFRGL